jgi:cell division initiation protein
VLTPLDIQNKEFKKGFRGYDEQEVDAYLDEVVRDFELALKERDDLKAQVAEVQHQVQQYRTLEEQLQKALLVAQQTAQEVVETAHKEAGLITDRAEAEGQKIAEQARSSVRAVEEQAARLRSDLEVFRAKSRSLLESQLKILEAISEGE